VVLLGRSLSTHWRLVTATHATTSGARLRRRPCGAQPTLARGGRAV